MMEPKEFAGNWKVVVDKYLESSNPKEAAENIVKEIGEDAAKETFAVFCAIKSYDGRLTKRNKLPYYEFAGTEDKIRYIDEIRYVDELFGLDKIHSAHVDQIIGYIK